MHSGVRTRGTHPGWSGSFVQEVIMRKLGLSSCVAIASLLGVYACAVDSTPDPSKNTSDVALPGNSEAPSASPNETTAEPLGLTSDALTPNACTVTLNFCDRPSSSVGTDCTKTSGCSLTEDAAINTCLSLVSQAGCAQHCDAVMRQGSGPNAPIVDTWRVQCGSTCCPRGDFCVGTRCCDGIHCGGGCPC